MCWAKTRYRAEQNSDPLLASPSTSRPTNLEAKNKKWNHRKPPIRFPPKICPHFEPFLRRKGPSSFLARPHEPQTTNPAAGAFRPPWKAPRERGAGRTPAMNAPGSASPALVWASEKNRRKKWHFPLRQFYNLFSTNQKNQPDSQQPADQPADQPTGQPDSQSLKARQVNLLYLFY